MLLLVLFMLKVLSLGLVLETVKESRKNWNFHFDLQLVPIVLEVTFVFAKKLLLYPKRFKISNL